MFWVSDTMGLRHTHQHYKSTMRSELVTDYQIHETTLIIVDSSNSEQHYRNINNLIKFIITF